MKLFARLTLLLVLFLAACTPAAPAAIVTPQPTRVAQKTPTVETKPASTLQALEPKLKGLTIQVWHPWFGTDASLFESLVEEFNSKNLWGFQVQSTGQVSYGVLFERTSAALPTPDRPGLVIALPEQARAWDDDGYVVDLVPYLDDPVYGWSADEVRDFPPAFWLQDSSGQRRVALPYQRTARFMLWNKSWAAELGFNAPPATPEDFSRQSCAATQALLQDAVDDNNGLGGWAVDTDAMTAFSWMRAFEGGVLEGSDYRFMTPHNIQAFTFLRKLQEDGCAWMPAADADPLAAFAGRSALFVTAPLEQFPDVTRHFASVGSTDDWVPLAFPGESQDALVFYGSSLVMLKSTDEAQLASWLFMDWLLSAENDARSSRTTGLFPLRASALAMLGDYSASHPRWQAAVDLIPDGEIQPQLASWRKVRVMLGDGFTQMFRVSLPSGQVPAILALMESTSRDLSK
jgi:ABC-type glycerol-3-phosphate transport system substrate-binding protein